MAKVVDPDALAQGTEVTIGTATKQITLNLAGDLDDDAPGSTSGVTLQCLYSFLKEEWKDDDDLNKYKFPLQMFTKTDGQFINGWEFADQQSRDLVRDAGWVETGSYTATGLISLGNFDASTDQAYYVQSTSYATATTVSDFDKTGNLNEAVDISAANTYIKSFLRIEGKTIDEYALVSEQGLSELEPVLYRQPLANADDPKITVSDSTVSTEAPYTSMKINYLAGTGFTTGSATTYASAAVIQDGEGRWAFCDSAGSLDAAGTAAYTANGGTGNFVAYDGEIAIGTAYYAFNRIIDANNATVNDLYQWMQWSLRQSTDINADDSTDVDQRSGLEMTGKLAERLGYFVGDNLNTYGGVGVTNLNTNSINDITLGDITVDGGGVDATTYLPVTSTPQTYPFTAAGSLVFSSNIVGEPDADTRYTMYFTDANGNAFDSSAAIIVDDNGGTDIDGTVTQGTITWDFDYDNNVQGGRTGGTDAAVTIVAQGLNDAQWVEVTSTITRTTGQTINVNASDERNYANT